MPSRIFRSAAIAGLAAALPLVPALDSLHAATLELPGRTAHIAKPDETVELLVRDFPPAELTADKSMPGLIAKDWLGNETAVPLTSVSANANILLVRFSPPWLGWMEIVLTIDGQPHANASTRLAVMPEAKSKGV
ncbi:MAG: hypothetical protein LBK99_20990 [Opitutaceae bacterium]|jgi:hypothetical protein|nr:hypothetical protein [Opitutaceae bacterium]